MISEAPSNWCQGLRYAGRMRRSQYSTYSSICFSNFAPESYQNGLHNVFHSVQQHHLRNTPGGGKGTNFSGTIFCVKACGSRSPGLCAGTVSKDSKTSCNLATIDSLCHRSITEVQGGMMSSQSFKFMQQKPV